MLKVVEEFNAETMFLIASTGSTPNSAAFILSISMFLDGWSILCSTLTSLKLERVFIVSLICSAIDLSFSKLFPFICTSIGDGFPSLSAAVIKPPVLKLISTPGNLFLNCFLKLLAYSKVLFLCSFFS